MSAVSHDDEKKRAAEAAADLVVDGMVVGLGTGSTVAHLLPAIAARGVSIRCVATSVATTEQARALGIEVEEFDRLDRLDIAIDGADQIAPDGWLVKGGGDNLLARVRAAELRPDTGPSPDGGLIADYRGEVGDPILLAARLSATPGVVDHGLFPPAMVADVLVARGDEVEHTTL